MGRDDREVELASDADPRLSICIPTYNMGRWVGNAVASALAVGFAEEVEIVVVDNCSTDDTGHVLAEFAEAPNLRVIRAAEHLDMIGNFNRAARASRGSWVTMLSADDQLAPSFYAHLREHVARRDSSALSQFATICWEHEETRFGPSQPHTFDLEELVTSLGTSVCIATTAFRRDLFDAIGGFDPAAGLIFDFDFFVRLSLASGLPVRTLGVEGGRYYPARGSSWQALERTGEATETRLRWIGLRRQDLGPDVARAAERRLAEWARGNGLTHLSAGTRDAARRELRAALKCTRGRDHWTTRAALLATWLPPSASRRLAHARAHRNDSGDVEHALERDAGPLGGALVDDDPVHHLATNQ